MGKRGACSTETPALHEGPQVIRCVTTNRKLKRDFPFPNEEIAYWLAAFILCALILCFHKVVTIELFLSTARTL